MKALFDASALLNIIRTHGPNALRYLRGGYILSLTPYEVGNALWKEATLMRRLMISEAVTLLNIISKTYNYLNIVNPENSAMALRLAHELRLTYYDSSYLVVAATLNVPLITDDAKLRERVRLRENKVKELLHRPITVYSSDEYLSKA